MKFPNFHEKNHWNMMATTKRMATILIMKTREMKNDFGSSTTNYMRIDKTDCDESQQAMTNIAFTCAHE